MTALVGSRPAPPKLARLDGLRVLVVDDDAETLEAVSEMLRHNGATVISAISAAEAPQAAQQSKLEVIVSDIAMPGTDGYSLIRAIRALPAAEQAGAAAIAHRGGRRHARERSLDAGFQEHIEKPADLDRLHARGGGRVRGTPREDPDPSEGHPYLGTTSSNSASSSTIRTASPCCTRRLRLHRSTAGCPPRRS